MPVATQTRTTATSVGRGRAEPPLGDGPDPVLGGAGAVDGEAAGIVDVAAVADGWVGALVVGDTVGVAEGAVVGLSVGVAVETTVGDTVAVALAVGDGLGSGAACCGPQLG